MGFTDSGPAMAEIPAFDASLAYSISRPWGLLAVTEEAHAAYGLEPQVAITGLEPDQTFAGLTAVADRRVTGSPLPGIHVLVASAAELGQEVLLGRTKAHSIQRPRSLQVTVAAGSDLAIAEEDVGFDFSILSELSGEDDPRVDVRGEAVPASELRKFFAQQQMMLAMGRTVGSTINSALPNCLRDDYNKYLVGTAGRIGLITTGATVMVDVLSIGAPHELAISMGGSLAMVGTAGLLGYRLLKHHAQNASEREQHWRERSRHVANVVLADFSHIYTPELPSGSDERWRRP